ncbi:unnamed protein product [Clonostachys solani]|uniref:Integral membrane protein n=1 Tax=Clonostachys solani TaxID=160281 RepID=A0A9N9VZR8_9HYPO|nr:unnamed protein product [Clonostachys solani]
MARRRRPPRAGALNELPPLKIAAQIAVLQALFYVSALVLMVFTALIGGMSFGPDLILGWDRIRGDTTRGWMLALVWIIDGGLCMAVAIVALIARSKLVPDFALTIHFLHLLVTTFYTGSIPSNMMWWGTMLLSTTVTISLGMWGCQHRELQPVFFGGGRILGNNGPPPSSTTAGSASDPHENDDEDIELGLSRGRGRDRSINEEYEMDKMVPSR